MAKPLPQYYRRAFQDFSGGLNDFSAPLTVKPNQFVELENAIVNDRGLLEKAKGYITDGDPFPNDVDSFARMMVNYKRGTSVDKLVVAALDDGNANATYKVDLKATAGNGTYSYIGYVQGTATFTNGSANVTAGTGAFTTHLKAGDKIKPDGTSVWYEISNVTGAGTLTLSSNFAEATQTNSAYMARIILHKDFVPQGITFNDNLVVTNGSETPMSWNNTSLTLITDADCPKGKFIEAHKSRVFIASTSGAPSSIFWSAANDETAWDAASVEPVFPKDGGNICAIKSFADSLIVFKDNGKIYQVAGSFDQSAAGEPDFIRRIDTPENMGVIAGRTAVVCDDGTLRFLARTGWYQIDGRLSVSKISWDVENLAASALIQPGPSQSKSYIFDTKTQWDTGTHSGTRATTSGNLETFFDEYSITDAKQANGLCAVHIDSSNVVHVAYVDTLGLIVKYKKYATNGDVTSETVATATNTVLELSMDVSPSGLVGVGWIEQQAAGSTHPVKFSERSLADSWAATETVFGGFAYTMAVKYTTANAARCVFMGAFDATNSRFDYYGRSGTTWALIGSSGFFAASTSQMALVLDGSNNPSVSFYNTNGNIVYHARSSDAGISFAAATDSVATTAIGTNSRVHIDIDAASSIFSFYGDNGTLKMRNHTAGTTATPDSTTDRACGFAINTVSGSERDNYIKWSSAGTESIVFDDSTAVANPTTGTAGTSYFTGYPGFHTNGTLMAASFFGANAAEILVRRYAPRCTYTAAEQSDSTLTAWSTYDVGGETVAGNTLTHQVALATSSPASSFNSITTGTIVSTDATMIYVIARITVVLAAWSKSSVGSITLNYVGSGVDARQPVGVLYDNEYHCALAESGQANNNLIAVFDRGNAWTTITPAVSCMCVYKNQLYAGLATRGRIVKLHTGYNHAGSAYTLTAITKEDLLGSIELEKTIDKVYIVFEVKTAGTFSFSYRLDNFTSATAATWNTTTIDQTQLGIAEVDVKNDGRSIQFKVEQSSVDGQLGVIGFVVMYEYLNYR